MCRFIIKIEPHPLPPPNPHPSYISWSSRGLKKRAPHTELLLLNVKYAADTAGEIFLLCFFLFPRCYILTLTFGCDKRKALNPTHMHTENSERYIPTELPHSGVQ